MKIICCNRMEIIRLDDRADVQMYMHEAPISAFFCTLSSKLWAFELGFMTQEFLMTAEKQSYHTVVQDRTRKAQRSSEAVDHSN